MVAVIVFLFQVYVAPVKGNMRKLKTNFVWTYNRKKGGVFYFGVFMKKWGWPDFNEIYTYLQPLCHIMWFYRFVLTNISKREILLGEITKYWFIPNKWFVANQAQHGLLVLKCLFVIICAGQHKHNTTVLLETQPEK